MITTSKHALSQKQRNVPGGQEKRGFLDRKNTKKEDKTVGLKNEFERVVQKSQSQLPNQKIFYHWVLNLVPYGLIREMHVIFLPK